jgi:hypothetical protein
MSGMGRGSLWRCLGAPWQLDRVDRHNLRLNHQRLLLRHNVQNLVVCRHC